MKLSSAAPEAIANDPNADPKQGVMWSCGVLLYLLLFHTYPFERADDTRDGPGYRKVPSSPELLATSRPGCPRAAHSMATCMCKAVGLLHG